MSSETDASSRAFGRRFGSGWRGRCGCFRPISSDTGTGVSRALGVGVRCEGAGGTRTSRGGSVIDTQDYGNCVASVTRSRSSLAAIGDDPTRPLRKSFRARTGRSPRGPVARVGHAGLLEIRIPAERRDARPRFDLIDSTADRPQGWGRVPLRGRRHDRCSVTKGLR